MKRQLLTITLILLLALSLVVSCGKDQPTEIKPPVSTTQPTPAPVTLTTFVMVVGGWGHDQTLDIAHTINTQCPRAEVWVAGSWDAYKVDIVAHVRANANGRKIVLIGHSFGAAAIINATHQLPFVELLIFVDPVEYDWGNTELPTNIGDYLWFRRTNPIGPFRADVKGGKYTPIEGGHNSIPHSPELIHFTVNAVNSF